MLSPVYESPMADHGYDIRDYRNVDPSFGELSDLKFLIERAHQHGIRIIMDMVLNHTSDQHPWFVESRSSRNNSKRDWYIWKNGKDDGSPNNWRAAFGGNAWQWEFNLNRGKSYKIVRSLRKLVDSYDKRVLIGEIFIQPPGDSRAAASYLGNGRDGLHMAFDFSLIFKRWNVQTYFETINSWYDYLPDKGWPCHVLSNHDLRRSIGRLGVGNRKYSKAKILAVLLLTLKGAPVVYYGEEIGMKNARIRPKDHADAVSKRYWPIYGRDQARTPMQCRRKKTPVSPSVNLAAPGP